MRNRLRFEGRHVALSDRRAGSSCAAATLALALFSGAPPVLAQGSAPALPGIANPDVHRVLVIPINLRGRAPVVVDRKQIAQALFGATQSVASRYRALSYGKVQFEGSQSDITASVTLSEPADICNAVLDTLAGEAKIALTQRGVAYGAYRHFVFVVPVDIPCWWIGVGRGDSDGVWVKATTAKALQHELGHNLGMNHALRWQGGQAEASDFMGSGSAGLNAPHVVVMGWFEDRPGKAVELTRATDVTLETLEAPLGDSALPKVAIVHPAGGNTYYLSYRASTPDDPLLDEFTRGVNIHIFNGLRHTFTPTYFVTGLSDGAVYRDGPVVITQLSHVAGRSVTFHIGFDGKGAVLPAGPPPGQAGTLQSRASGKCVDLPGGTVSDGAQAIQYDCHGGPNQQWRIDFASAANTQIVSRLSGKCLGADSANAGRAVVQSRCSGSPEQLWRQDIVIDGTLFRNIASGLCLDVPGASVANGAKLIVWTCHGGVNQTWRYQPPAAP